MIQIDKAILIGLAACVLIYLCRALCRAFLNYISPGLFVPLAEMNEIDAFDSKKSGRLFEEKVVAYLKSCGLFADVVSTNTIMPRIKKRFKQKELILSSFRKRKVPIKLIISYFLSSISDLADVARVTRIFRLNKVFSKLNSISSDLGGDILACYGSKRCLFQCKYHKSSNVPPNEVHDGVAARDTYEVDYSCIITNQKLSDEARAYAECRGIYIFEREQLIWLIGDQDVKERREKNRKIRKIFPPKWLSWIRHRRIARKK